MQKAPCGTWTSPVTSDLIVAESIGVGGAVISGNYRYWQEARPQEGGRIVVVRQGANGKAVDMNPSPTNARSRVHEYGGAAWLVHDDQLYFVNFADQQVYRQLHGQAPEQLTHAPGLRFANGTMDTTRNRIIYVIEDHTDTEAEPRNLLGAVDLATGEVTRLAEGHDFYAAPAVSPDGERLAWITWDHPNMPWDGTCLWCAELDDSGLPGRIEQLAGGREESVQQPRFGSDGEVYFVSDRSGWWNLYRTGSQDTPLCTLDAEFGVPQWGLGICSWTFLDPRSIVCIYSRNNESTLARLEIASGRLDPIELPFTDISGISVAGNQAMITAASPTQFSSIVELDLASGDYSILRTSCEVELDAGYYSVPEAITFPTAGGDTAHAFYYPPSNRDFSPSDGELPPLIVEAHGGPTAASRSALDLRTQYWTSRGFAILDVNYRGSTGYGRAYRQKLNGNWGVTDVEDVVHGARSLVDRGLADPARLAIHGGSAGGYTTLAALAFKDTFRAGASYYGVADLTALARDTHKFESRYLDSMVGRYPEDEAIYTARSPLANVDGLSCPVIFFQGLEDRVVPPNQAEVMVEALRRKGVPVAYVPYEGEQHGFRKAENIKRTLDLELYFYGKLFGFEPADPISPIEIENLD